MIKKRISRVMPTILVSVSMFILSGCGIAKDMQIGGENSGSLTSQIKSSSRISSCIDTGADFQTSIEVNNSSNRAINVSYITVQFYRGKNLVGEAIFSGPDPLPVGRTYSDRASKQWWDGSAPLTCSWGAFNIYGR